MESEKRRGLTEYIDQAQNLSSQNRIRVVPEEDLKD